MNEKSKLFFVVAVFMIVCAVTVMAGQGNNGKDFERDKSLKNGNGPKDKCSVGISENVSFIDSDGSDMIMIVENGLIVGVEAVVVEVPNETDATEFPADGLVAYYKLDETSETLAYDSYGSNDGTNNGADSGQTSNMGTAYDFDGTSSYIQRTSFPGFNGTGLTFSAWVNLDRNSDVAYGNIIEFESNSGQNVQFNQRSDNGGFSLQSYMEVGTWKTVTDVFSRPSGEWYFLTGTYDKATQTSKIYLDGTLKDEISSVGLLDSNSGTLYVGKAIDGNWNYVDGRIDEIGIWNRPLNASEIEQLWNDGTGLTYTA